VSDGRIVGDGRHDDLVTGCAEYARLVRHQLGVEAGDVEPKRTPTEQSERAA